MKLLPKNAGKQLISFVTRHRFSILLTAIVAYFLFWPKPVPHISAEIDKPIVVPQSQSNIQSVVQPAQSSSNSVAKSAAYVPIYDPASGDADAKWSLPAELKSEELQSFARQVDKLLKDWKEMKRLEKLQSSLIYTLTRDTVKDALWPGINGNGFKDPKLPLDWYELVKEHATTA